MNLIFKNYIYLNDDESAEVLDLRNEKNIREQMKNSDLISIDDHKKFIRSLNDNTNKEYFAVYDNKFLIGSLNIVYNNELSWGLYFKDVSPIKKSIATYIFLEYIFENFDDNLFSYIKKNNTKALKFNYGFGFRNFREDEEYYYLLLSKNKWQNIKEFDTINSFKKYLNRIKYSFIK